MSSAAEAAAAAMAGAKVGQDYIYLNKKFGRYELEIQALKFTQAGKPCIEAKVLKAEKTQANEPHKVGDIVSHLEDLSDPKKGGASRLLKALLSILPLTEADISTLEMERNGKTVVLEGENAKKQWLVKLLDQVKQPTAFMRVNVEIEPRPVEAKDGQPAKVFSKERWSKVEIDDAAADAIDAKRKEAKLPPLAEALK